MKKIEVFPLKGVILAAGEGKRMQEITYGAIPKELLPIGSIPAIRFPIESVRLTGTKDLMIVIARKTGHSIVDAFGSGKDLGIDICYVVQEKSGKKSIGIGPAILTVEPWIDESEDFIVACGDSVVCDFSSSNPLNCLKPMLRIHEKFRPLATLLIYQAPMDPKRYGIVRLKHLKSGHGFALSEIDDLIEKPDEKESARFLAFNRKKNGLVNVIAGYYIFEPRIFDYVKKTEIGKHKEVQITDSMKVAINNDERIYAVIYKKKENVHYWDVGLPAEYRHVNTVLSQSRLKLFGGR